MHKDVRALEMLCPPLLDVPQRLSTLRHAENLSPGATLCYVAVLLPMQTLLHSELCPGSRREATSRRTDRITQPGQEKNCRQILLQVSKK